MKNFIKNFWVPTVVGLFGLGMAYYLSWLFEDHQVGLGPETIIKSFYKLFYVAFVWYVSHVIVKYWFPTIYQYSEPKGGESEFRKAWNKLNKMEYDPRIRDSIQVHLGVMLIVAVIMAFAF